MLKQISPLDGYEVAKAAPSAFTGGTANTRGDSAGSDAAHTLFQVNGEVIVRVFGVCTVSLEGSGTLEVGVAGNTAVLIPQSTGTDLDAGDVWVDATPAEVGAVLLSAVPAATLIVNGADIIETTATADITAGNIYYICLWKPLSSGATVKGLPITEGATTRFDQ